MKELIRAYEETIRDFKIELNDTEWWRFKRISYLNEMIEKYEDIIDVKLRKQNSK